MLTSGDFTNATNSDGARLIQMSVTMRIAPMEARHDRAKHVHVRCLSPNTESKSAAKCPTQAVWFRGGSFSHSRTLSRTSGLRRLSCWLNRSCTPVIVATHAAAIPNRNVVMIVVLALLWHVRPPISEQRQQR